MHVAIVCRGLGHESSVATVALRQARELARHARVTLVSDCFPDALPFAATAVAPVPDLHALRRFRHVVDEVLFTRAARRALFALHERDSVDFVLCHGHAPAVLVGRPFRQATGTPFGLFVHADISDRPSGTYDRRLTAFYEWATPRAYESADIVFVLSPAYQELVARRGARNVVVVPNGVDPEDLAVRPVRPPAPPLRLLYVGRLALEKGIGVLLEAMQMVRADVTLDVVGGGPLEAEVRSRAAGERIRFLGQRPHAELGAIYAAHHVLCVPSLSEPFGLVIIEALARNTPVIASKTGGIPSIVEHRFNGLLVPPDDPAALAQAIDTLAGDESLRAELTANAHKSVIPRFTWPSIGDRLAELIRTIIA